MHYKYLIRVLVTQKEVCSLDVSMHIFMLMDIFQNIKLTKQKSCKCSTQVCPPEDLDSAQKWDWDIYRGKTDLENKMYFLNLLFSGLTVVQFYGKIALHSLHTSSEDPCQICPLS